MLAVTHKMEAVWSQYLTNNTAKLRQLEQTCDMSLILCAWIPYCRINNTYPFRCRKWRVFNTRSTALVSALSAHLLCSLAGCVVRLNCTVRSCVCRAIIELKACQFRCVPVISASLKNLYRHWHCKKYERCPCSVGQHQAMLELCKYNVSWVLKVLKKIVIYVKLAKHLQNTCEKLVL